MDDSAAVAVSLQIIALADRLRPFLCFRSQRRNPAVGRIHHKRSPLIWREPFLKRGEAESGGVINRLLHWVRACIGVIVAALQTSLDGVLRLLIGEELSPLVFFGPLHRREAHACPIAM